MRAYLRRNVCTVFIFVVLLLVEEIALPLINWSTATFFAGLCGGVLLTAASIADEDRAKQSSNSSD